MTDSDDPDTPFRYESEQPPNLAVVNTLANLEGVDSTDLDHTLYDYIHPEALNILARLEDVELTFPVEQYPIYLTKSGTIRITQ